MHPAMPPVTERKTAYSFSMKSAWECDSRICLFFPGPFPWFPPHWYLLSPLLWALEVCRCWEVSDSLQSIDSSFVFPGGWILEQRTHPVTWFEPSRVNCTTTGEGTKAQKNSWSRKGIVLPPSPEASALGPCGMCGVESSGLLTARHQRGKDCWCWELHPPATEHVIWHSPIHSLVHLTVCQAHQWTGTCYFFGSS